MNSPTDQTGLMPRVFTICGFFSGIWLLFLAAQPSRADELAAERKAVERALTFIEQDALAWREKRECATCHHGVMTVWVLCEAKRSGYAVTVETLAEMTAWTKDRFFSKLDQPRDSRPGWNLVSTPSVFLAAMSQAVPASLEISPEERQRIASHVARHQETDGGWLIPPPPNGPPPVWESREVLALWALSALDVPPSDDPQRAVSLRESRAKATAWLSDSKSSETTQTVALRLFRDVREGKASHELQPRIDHLLKLQNAEGSWSQDKDLPGDAYATGQALYFLSLAGVKPSRPEIGRSVAFLVAQQKLDGSWPMTSRAHPGAKPFTNLIPITYFGSAWATLGLLRSVGQ